ncbi:hypothetical protein JADG_008852 [Aureobasidium aubasidani]|nr:hypothetical protein JADG_008852 [Aureobasidium pullulans]
MRIRYKIDQLHDPEKLHHSYTRSRPRDKSSIMSCGIQTSATFKIATIKEQITAKEEQITAKEEQIAEHQKNIEALEAEVKTLRDEEKAEEEIRTGCWW